MSFGVITRWRYVDINDNDGTIAGCSADVRGQFFTFFIGGVANAALRAYLTSHTSINVAPDCAAGPGPLWVTFAASQGIATGIAPMFPDSL